MIVAVYHARDSAPAAYSFSIHTERTPWEETPLGEKIFLDKFYEVTEVVRTVHVQAGDSHYRIEVNKHRSNPQTPFTVRYFVKHQVPSPEAKIGAETLDTYLLDTSQPWVAERTPEAALATALSFLGDRHPKTAAKSA